jgi:D-amino-acid dehydrogenase
LTKTSAERRVLVVGAGAVGLSAALQLQRRGFSVTVVEENSPGGGASHGNSGMLAANNAMPTFQPGMVWKVPGWLADPLGPLTVKVGYLPRALPWLWRYLRSSTRSRVFETAQALRALHRATLEGWRDNVGDEVMARLTRQDGQVYLWEGVTAPPARSIEDEVRAHLGIESEVLGADRIRQYFPGIAREVSHGLLLPGNGHALDPRRLVGALAEAFQREGEGVLLRERVLRIWREDGRWTVMTNLGNHDADALVVAAGAWSGRLLAPLGVAIPLETERGYHAMLKNPSVRLGMPILNKSRYFGLNSMAEGLRVSGTVEIAGLDAPPTLVRAKVLTAQAKRLFPDLSFDDEIYWMGHRPSIPDGLPAIGEIPGQPGLFACFGHGHTGMTAAPASGRLLAELMAGDRPTIEPGAYSPARFA